MPDSDDSARYSDAEEAAVRATWSETGAAVCPRCGVAMRARSIAGGSFGLGYRRHREWLLCAKCKRSVLFDAERGTRT